MTKIYHNILGEDNEQTLVIIHGFLGSSDNWRTFAKYWSTKYKVILYDQRNHGRSFHSTDWNYDFMAEDLKALLDMFNLKNVYILGHSMGGKTAQYFVGKYPSYCSKLVVLDMGCKKYEPQHDNILLPMLSLDLDRIKSRKDADDILKSSIQSTPVRLFILKNLIRSDDAKSFLWKPNLKVFLEQKKEIGQPVPTTMKFEKHTLFLIAGQSNYILEEDKPGLLTLFPNAQFKTIPHASHWLHVDAPEEMYKTVNEFFNE